MDLASIGTVVTALTGVALTLGTTLTTTLRRRALDEEDEMVDVGPTAPVPPVPPRGPAGRSGIAARSGMAQHGAAGSINIQVGGDLHLGGVRQPRAAATTEDGWPGLPARVADPRADHDQAMNHLHGVRQRAYNAAREAEDTRAQARRQRRRAVITGVLAALAWTALFIAAALSAGHGYNPVSGLSILVAGPATLAALIIGAGAVGSAGQLRRLDVAASNGEYHRGVAEQRAKLTHRIAQGRGVPVDELEDPWAIAP